MYHNINQAMLCALSMNVAIVGLNQVYDKKIDAVRNTIFRRVRRVLNCLR